MDQKSDQSGDLLYGMGAIAKHLGITRRQAYHRHERGELPTFTMGAGSKTICARKSTLDATLAAWESAARRHGGEVEGARP
jgi:hypothetical protein